MSSDNEKEGREEGEKEPNMYYGLWVISTEY
jgi:hypothetical protein